MVCLQSSLPARWQHLTSTELTNKHSKRCFPVRGKPRPQGTAGRTNLIALPTDRPGELWRSPLDLRLSHLVAAPTRMAAVCFLLAVFTDTTFLSFPGAVIHEGRTLFLLSDFRVSIAMVFHTQGLASLQQDQKSHSSHRAYLTPEGADLECLQGGTKSVDSSKPMLFQFTSNNYWSV